MLKKRRVVRNGSPTNDLVLSAHTDGIAEVFPRILALYVSPGSIVADVTFGEGVFWRNIPKGKYDLRSTDISSGIDCRVLPYQDDSVDCVVLDPPYMHSPGGADHERETALESHYRNNGTDNNTAKKHHEAVVELYKQAGAEAFRVLRERGVLIVKCPDEVCANHQPLTHVEIIQAYEALGFVTEDLFVVVRNNRPDVSSLVRQVHAHKNHSFFLVLWKRTVGPSRWKPPA